MASPTWSTCRSPWRLAIVTGVEVLLPATSTTTGRGVPAGAARADGRQVLRRRAVLHAPAVRLTALFSVLFYAGPGPRRRRVHGRPVHVPVLRRLTRREWCCRCWPSRRSPPIRCRSQWHPEVWLLVAFLAGAVRVHGAGDRPARGAARPAAREPSPTWCCFGARDARCCGRPATGRCTTSARSTCTRRTWCSTWCSATSCRRWHCWPPRLAAADADRRTAGCTERCGGSRRRSWPGCSSTRR